MRIVPANGDTSVKPKAVVVDFDEIISETPSGAPELAGLVVLSPKSGDVRVNWKRSRMEIIPKRGFRDSAVYSVLIRSGIVDLRGNKLDSAISLVFSTGGPIPNTTVRGELFDWAAGKAAPGALVEAMRVSDTTLVYITVADSSGRFRMQSVPSGEYLLRGYLDRNSNRTLERTEAFDSLRVTLTDTLFAELYAYIHDTLPARINDVALQDSSRRLQITFDKPLSVQDSVLPSQFVVRALPDSQPLAVRALSVRTRAQQALVDSLVKVAAADSATKAKAPKDSAKVDSAALRAARAREDSLERLRRRDSIAAAEAAAREERRLLALRGGRPLPQKDTTPPPALKRPVPATELLVQLDTALPPETRLLIEARDIVTLSGVAGSAFRPLLTPKRDTTPPKKDTAKAAAPTKDTAAADTAAKRDTATAKRETAVRAAPPPAPARDTTPPARDSVSLRRDLALPRSRR